MNWRLVGINDTTAGVAACKGQTTAAADPRCRDHFYNQPNLDLMPGLAAPNYEWFSYLEAQGVKTYFNGKGPGCARVLLVRRVLCLLAYLCSALH